MNTQGKGKWKGKWKGKAKGDAEVYTVEIMVGNVLRAGVVVAGVIALIGTLLYIARHGGASANYQVFHGVPDGLDSVTGVVSGALTGHAAWLIQLGLLLLIATPVVRVALSLFAFLLEKDFKYVVITTIVLAVLTYSLLGSH